LPIVTCACKAEGKKEKRRREKRRREKFPSFLKVGCPKGGVVKFPFRKGWLAKREGVVKFFIVLKFWLII
jgi:hypothetical protein